MEIADLVNQELKVRVSKSDPLDSTLDNILTMVNDWLKFAEAKNGGAVGLGSGAVAILLGYLDKGGFSAVAGTILTLGGICLLFSVIVGIGSFSPRTDFLRLKAQRHGKPTRSDNLYYFGHLAKYSPRGLVEALADKYLPDFELEMKDSYLDLASQVTINARITMWKLRLFTISVGLFGAGVVLCALGAIVHIA